MSGQGEEKPGHYHPDPAIDAEVRADAELGRSVDQLVARITELEAGNLELLKRLYELVPARKGDPKLPWDERLVLRIWDGMDGCWTDCVDGDAETVLREWYQKTDGGTKNVSFNDIDYYRIFPANTKMTWDGGPGGEMFRDD